MSLKRTIDKLLNIYGIDVVLRKYEDTFNEYGELVEGLYTDTEIKAIIDSYILTSFARQLFGYSSNDNSTIIISSDVSVNKTDKIIMEGKEFSINEVRDLIYKGEVVAKQVVLI